MADRLEELVSSLLYEGYALYPYTPGATKNATPTPFGIVYPPAYAERGPATFDHLQVECVVAHDEGAAPTVTGEIRFLQAAGPRHQGRERVVRLWGVAPGGPAAEAAFDLLPEEEGEGGVRGRALLEVEPLGPGLARARLRVENTTPIAPERAAALDRGAALRHSLLSTHALARVSGGRFVSPLERDGRLGEAVAGCRNVNTWPVLATDADDAVLGAAIMLPDHPQLAPESRGNLFDNTEIEEALLLHVHALSDQEREDIGAQDPAVREMIARAAASTPEDLLALHGRLQWVEPHDRAGGRPAEQNTPPAPPPGVFDDTPGEERTVVDGVTFERGGKVVLRPGAFRDFFDGMLQGKLATIERIYVDYDDRVHLAVTVDDDPGRELLRETGRYLFFFPHEVEVLGP
jgi:hypothetical protein